MAAGSGKSLGQWAGEAADARPRPSNVLGVKMAEKVKQLGLKRDYKKYLYFIDGDGNICQKPKTGDGNAEVLVPNAVERDNQFLYFIDKEGDVSRSPRGSKGSKKKAA